MTYSEEDLRTRESTKVKPTLPKHQIEKLQEWFERRAWMLGFDDGLSSLVGRKFTFIFRPSDGERAEAFSGTITGWYMPAAGMELFIDTTFIYGRRVIKLYNGNPGWRVELAPIREVEPPIQEAHFSESYPGTLMLL